MAMASRRFFEELGHLINRVVQVEDTKGRVIEGKLLGFDTNTLSLCLSDVRGERGESLHRVFIYGSTISRILASERPFNLEGLAERLERVFPNMVRLFPEAGVIVVMDKIRVDESGVVEGSGPAAERVRRVYEEFVREMR